MSRCRIINVRHFLTEFFCLTESSGEVSGAGDPPGVRPGHDSVQGAEATREPRTAEVRRRGHQRGHQVPAGEAGREHAGSQVPGRLPHGQHTCYFQTGAVLLRGADCKIVLYKEKLETKEKDIVVLDTNLADLYEAIL